MTTKERFTAARPAVETYLKALALHRTADAAPVVQAAGTFANQSTLDDLQTWFGRLPIGAVKMTAKPVKVPDPGSVGVRVSISARFSPAPLSNWVKLGDRVMLASYSEGAWRVVDTALDLAGGFGVLRRAGLERLWRDARLGRVHPGNSMLTHEIVAKSLLGIDLDEQPRWG